MDPERPLLEHLEELRRRLGRSLLYAAAGVAVAFWAFRPVSNAIRAQLKDAFTAVGRPADFDGALLSLSPTDVVGMLTKFSLAGGLLLALPLLLVQAWGFVSPALRARESRVGFWIVVLGPVLFALGFLFSFTKVTPLAAECLLRLSYHYGFTPRWTAESYYGFFLVMNLAFGACFELPLVMVLISAMGIVQPSFFGKWRRHWVVASFAIGAVLPPPEAVSMCLQAAALIALYEVGILLSRLFARRA